MLRNEQTKQVHLPEVYLMPPEAQQNVQTWMGASLARDAVPNIIYVSSVATRGVGKRGHCVTIASQSAPLAWFAPPSNPC